MVFIIFSSELTHIHMLKRRCNVAAERKCGSINMVTPLPAPRMRPPVCVYCSQLSWNAKGNA